MLQTEQIFFSTSSSFQLHERIETYKYWYRFWLQKHVCCRDAGWSWWRIYNK